MNFEEFKKLKVGDKVQIVKGYDHKDVSSRWNCQGKMDKWLGKVMTIRYIDTYYINDMIYLRMEEDQNEHFDRGWMWFPEMIKRRVEEETIVIKSDGKTITAYRGKEKGVAICSSEDEFDLYTGASLALGRLFGKETTIDIPAEDLVKREVVEEPKEFKPGDKVRIVSSRPDYDYSWNPKMDKWLGKVMTIRELYSDCAYHMEEDRDEWHGCCGKGFLWKKDWIEKKVTSPYDDICKLAKTSRKSTDALDGLTYAFCVMDELNSKPEVKEVKREAKKGDWIKIVNPSFTEECYSKGDILKVYKRSRKHNGVYCETKKKVNKYSGINNDKGNVIIVDREYVVLEGYEPTKEETKPKVKEVKRPAKKGEWIKIVNPTIAGGLYEKGDILKVLRTYPADSYDGVDVELVSCTFGPYYIHHSEYVVLENYQPEEK